MGRLTDQAGNLDTSGTRGGPHTNIKGVAPVFDIAAEQAGYAPERDIPLGQRFKEKAVAGNGDDSGPWPEHDRASHQQARITDQTEDTTGTDTQAASGEGHETVQALQTDTWDTTGGQPSPAIDGVSSVEDGTSLKGEGSFTTAAAAGAAIVEEVSEALGSSDPDADGKGDDEDGSASAEDEHGTEGEGDGDQASADADAERDAKIAAFEEVPMNDLYRLAKEQDPPVTIPAGADKPTLIGALVDAGVNPPTPEG